MSELLNYISDTKNGEYNFNLGKWYEDKGHTAAAAGYYIRTAEFSINNELIYEALLRAAICLLKQGSRVFMSKGILLRAMALIPTRPEAFFLLSQACERNKDWQESYTYACLGEGLDDNSFKLRTDVGYPGAYGFMFEKAVSGWWCGLIDESMYLFRQLNKRSDLQIQYAVAVRNNLKNLDNSHRNPIQYFSSMYERLKIKFNGSRDIQQNYSQAFQDIFVLTVLDGKRNGRFVEIGCGDPFYGNNTALLEELGWIGISIDIDPVITKGFSDQRTSNVITADATRLNYNELLSGDYDYLQIDCDPALNSLMVLFKMPFDKCKFAVITFEHDDYCSEGVKERSRSYLKSLGYEMVVGDIAPDSYMNFEDWWVHPGLVNNDLLSKLKIDNDKTKRADEYILRLG